MGISQATSAIMVFLTGLLPASCHKTSTSQQQQQQQQQQQPPPAAASATAPQAAGKFLQHNLGNITLTNKNDLYVQFDNGEFCTLTPRMVDRNSVRITFAVESRKKNGETSDFIVKEVIAKPGMPLEVAVGDLNLAFTPDIVSDQEK